MSEMVKRVAEAIRKSEAYWWNRPDEPEDDLAETLARAAIEAMREPTEAMDAAARTECRRMGVEPVTHIWDVMLDSAINDGG